MADLFGFTITRKKEQGASFTLPTPDDGAEDIAQGGFFSSVYDIEEKIKPSLTSLEDTDILHNNQSVTVQLRISLVKESLPMNLTHQCH